MDSKSFWKLLKVQFLEETGVVKAPLQRDAEVDPRWVAAAVVQFQNVEVASFAGLPMRKDALGLVRSWSKLRSFDISDNSIIQD